MKDNDEEVIDISTPTQAQRVLIAEAQREEERARLVTEDADRLRGQANTFLDRAAHKDRQAQEIRKGANDLRAAAAKLA